MAQKIVKCPKCSSEVIPRLWSYRDGIASHRLTEHICTICGAVMYETGGETKEGAKLGVLGVLMFFFLASLFDFNLFGMLVTFVLFCLAAILFYPKKSGHFVGRLKRRVHR